MRLPRRFRNRCPGDPHSFPEPPLRKSQSLPGPQPRRPQGKRRRVQRSAHRGSSPFRPRRLAPIRQLSSPERGGVLVLIHAFVLICPHGNSRPFSPSRTAERNVHSNIPRFSDLSTVFLTGFASHPPDNFHTPKPYAPRISASTTSAETTRPAARSSIPFRSSRSNCSAVILPTAPGTGDGFTRAWAFAALGAIPAIENTSLPVSVPSITETIAKSKLSTRLRTLSHCTRRMIRCAVTSSTVPVSGDGVQSAGTRRDRTLPASACTSALPVIMAFPVCQPERV